MNIKIFSLSAVALLAASSGAHPPDEHDHHDSAPIWRNAVTGVVVDGHFLASRGEEVVVETQDGAVRSFAFNELVPEDMARAHAHMAVAAAINGVVLSQPDPSAPEQARSFAYFSPFVKTRWDTKWLYIESDGLPHEPAAHNMMT
ncbi:MAG: hypothetical protein ACK54H_11880, partial [Phycisphaerales bacterium]